MRACAWVWNERRSMSSHSKRGEKALRHRIVVAIAGGPGRGHDSPLPTSLTESERSVLCALVGVMDDPLGTALCDRHVQRLEHQLGEVDWENEELRRLTTIPGVGEVTALAVHAFAPSMDSFARGRDFAAWIGLTPREISTGGRQRLGRITKMGQRDLRQLLVLGATAVIRHARRREEITDPWLRRMLAEKPAKLVAVALANKMARIIWALMVKNESYRAPMAMSAVAG